MLPPHTCSFTINPHLPKLSKWYNEKLKIRDPFFSLNGFDFFLRLEIIHFLLLLVVGLWLHRMVSMYHENVVTFCLYFFYVYVRRRCSIFSTVNICESTLIEHKTPKYMNLFSIWGSTATRADLWKRIKCDKWCHRLIICWVSIHYLFIA